MVQYLKGDFVQYVLDDVHLNFEMCMVPECLNKCFNVTVKKNSKMFSRKLLVRYMNITITLSHW